MTLSYDAPLDISSRSEANPLDLPTALSVAGAGLFALTVARLDAPETALLGRGVVDLLVGLPLLLGATWLARRGSLAGRLLWMGALAHLTSSSARAVLGAHDAPFVPAHVALVAAGLYALLDLLLDVDADAVKSAFGARAPARSVAAFLALAAVVLASSGSAADGTLLRVLDVTLVLPVILLVSAALGRRKPWGFVLAGVLLPSATLSAFAVASTTLHGEPARAVAFALLGLVGAGLSTRYFRSIERSADPLPALATSSPNAASVEWSR